MNSSVFYTSYRYSTFLPDVPLLSGFGCDCMGGDSPPRFSRRREHHSVAMNEPSTRSSGPATWYHAAGGYLLVGAFVGYVC